MEVVDPLRAMPSSRAPEGVRRLVPGAEWKADVAFALAGGDVDRAGELLFSDRSEAWWVEQQAMGQLVAASGTPEWKCRIALATHVV